MKALLLVTSSARDVDFYYATKFWVEDPAIFIQTGKKKILALSQYEAGRAKKEAEVGEIIDIQAYSKKKRLKNPSMIKIVSSLLQDLKIAKIVVPSDFNYQLGKDLEKQGFVLEVKNPVFPGRLTKSKAEIKCIVAVQRKMEEVLSEALEIIKKSRIKGKLLYYQGEILTSEEIRRFINSELLKRDCMPVKDTITSSSDQACDVHFFGSGPLKANSAIIIDIFPRSLKTKYWSDMTRTVVKGKASPELKKLYNTVLAGQKKALAIVKAGVSGAEIDKIIRDFFIKEGYQTKEIKGKMQGFVHGTGHGVGLDIHEEPRIHQENRILLKAGNVITVEPGLYYLGLGGVRIEDTVAVTEEGCLNLAKFPKQLLEL